MVRIEKFRSNDGAGNAVLDLQVSTVAFYTLDDDGNWYDQSGNKAG